MFVFAVRAIMQEIVTDLVYAPIWWYTVGAVRAFERLRLRFHEGNEYLGWSVWVSNLFRPMYAQRDIAGRLISFTVRVAQIIVRSVLLMVWGVASAALFLLYLILPLMTIMEIAYQWRVVVLP